MATPRKPPHLHKPMGRPSTYSPDRGLEVCRLLASGELLIDICAREGMPSTATIWDWRVKHPDFADAFRLARIEQAHNAAERAVSAGRTATPENAAAQRVIMDANKWLASKLSPRHYGDKLESVVTAEIGVTDRTTVDATTLNDDQRAALRAALTAAALPAPINGGE